MFFIIRRVSGTRTGAQIQKIKPKIIAPVNSIIIAWLTLVSLNVFNLLIKLDVIRSIRGSIQLTNITFMYPILLHSRNFTAEASYSLLKSTILSFKFNIPCSEPDEEEASLSRTLWILNDCNF